MSNRISRRKAIATAGASGIALATHSVHAATGSSDSWPKATTDNAGRTVIPIRVVSADDFQPVEKVVVEITHVGLSGDGGFATHRTDSNGVALLTDGIFEPGPYQIHLRPPAGSRFADTAHQKPHDLLVLQADGSYFPAVFRIAYSKTQHAELRSLCVDSK